MKIINLTCVLLSIGLSVAGAQALADTDSSAYLLASYGESDSEFSVSANDKVQGDDKSLELGVGFAFSEHLSVEASYQDFGNPDGFVGCPPDVFCIAIVPFSREPVDIDGWAAALRAALPITDTLSVFGRFGLLAWDSSARSPELNDSGTDLLYGIGIAVEFSERVGLQVSYEKAEVDIETVKLGLRLEL